MTMIRKVRDSTASSTWSIYDVEIKLWKRKHISEDLMIEKILEYMRILESRSYEINNEPLCQQFIFWGGIPFISIGFIAFSELFIPMFQFFAKQHAEQWANGDKVLHSKEIGITYIFELMLRHPDYDITYDFTYILEGIEKRRILYDLAEEEFAIYWAFEIEKVMEKGDSFSDISKRIGMIRVTRYAMRVLDKTKAYVEKLAQGYTKRRERISDYKLHQDFFGDNYKINGQDKYDSAFKAMVKSIVQKEYSYQYENFPKTNPQEMDNGKDRWVLYGHHGPSLVYNEVDFSEIHASSLRQEVKYYIHHRYEHHAIIKNRFTSGIALALNLITQENPMIHYFADIDKIDAKALHLALEKQLDNEGIYMSTVKIMGIFSKLKVVIKYLMSEHRDEGLKTPIPKDNVFEKYVFLNSKDYVTNTPVMPECVVEGLSKVTHELNEMDQLVYKIFSNTGLRTKEVLFLEEDCIEMTRYEGLMAIRYKPYKVINARKKHSLSEYNRVMIHLTFADEITAFIESTKELRKSYGLPYIFINKRKGHKLSLMNMPYYVQKINKLIQKHHITDDNGSVWYFTNRQYRKTLAVSLIENGATVEELAYWLGHLNRETAAKYYAEVRAKKLGEMNTAFFKEKFELLLSGEQLSLFNEEERQLLYVDFRLEQRRVELGYCLRKRSEGDCNKRNSLFHCIFCNQLCTGQQYLSYWQELCTEQRDRFEQLMELYQKEGVVDYHNYKEYQQEKMLMDGFNALVSSIIERGNQ